MNNMILYKNFCWCLTCFILSSCSSLNWKPDPELFEIKTEPSNTELNFQYFGATSLLINDRDTFILIDGFFTRKNIWTYIKEKLHSDELQVKRVIKKANINKVDALLISHSHYDHILDVRTIISNKHIQQPIRVYGSVPSNGIIESKNFVPVKNCDVTTIGKFKVTFFETPHVKKGWIADMLEYSFLWLADGLGYSNPYTNYSFLLEHEKGNVLVVPSANFNLNQFRGLDVDIVFLGVGLLARNGGAEQIEKYWQEAVVNTKADIVIPIHWDPFDNVISTKIDPTPYMFDNLKLTMKELIRLAKTHNKSLKLLPGLDNTTPLISSNKVKEKYNGCPKSSAIGK